MEDVSGNVKDAYYDTFRIEDEVSKTHFFFLYMCLKFDTKIIGQ